MFAFDVRVLVALGFLCCAVLFHSPQLLQFTVIRHVRQGIDKARLMIVTMMGRLTDVCELCSIIIFLVCFEIQAKNIQKREGETILSLYNQSSTKFK